MMGKRLYKSRTDVKVDGVCAGVAHYFGIDVTLVRIIWLVSVFMGSAGFWVYLVCAIVMPREPRDNDRDYDDVKDLRDYPGNEN